jgi:hypothetical protein
VASEDHSTPSGGSRQTFVMFRAKSRLASSTTRDGDEIEQLLLEGHVDADSAEPTAAWPAARRAVSTRNGEQLT